MNYSPPKILMFGWEFPPHNSGGLGVACEGLVGGLAALGVRIAFVLPRKTDCRCDNCRFVWCGQDNSDAVKTITVSSPLSPYLTAQSYEQVCQTFAGTDIHNDVWRKDLVGEVMRYAAETEIIASREEFDVIHCHDWLSLPAGLKAKEISGKPLVFQIHATEYDRVHQDCMNREICAIEKEGLERADAVVAVSNYTKRRIVDCYNIDPEKIKVVPNAIDHSKFSVSESRDLERLKKSGKKIVLFVGRLTFQKGPDYFLAAAKKVSKIDQNIIFVFAGSGDMEHWLIEESARLGLSDKVIFSGFMRGNDLNRLYRIADLYVMPSVSEPFGLTSLEALASGTPILVSRQSGVSDMAMSGTTATLLARRWESALLVNVDNGTLKRLMDNGAAMDALMSIEGFRNLNQDIETIINKSESVEKIKKEANDKELSEKKKKELTEEEKEYKSVRKQIQVKLIKFATRIPVFMYLTDYRERALEDVITKLEPGLFKKVTGLTQKDFELLVSLGVFNKALMNDAVYKFKRYEDASLAYAGINKHEGEDIGLFDTVITPKDYGQTFGNEPIE